MSNSYRFIRNFMGCVGSAALFAAMTTPLHAAINDTGITTCSDGTKDNLSCPVAGLPGQDAEYGSNGFDFTKLDASGNVLPSSATDHACVRDNVTGLVWEVKTSDGGPRDQQWIYTWYDSQSATNSGNAGVSSGGHCHDTGHCDTDKYVQDVNATGLCGSRDWRMPTAKELAGIVNYRRPSPGPTIDVGYFPNAKSSYFWTSTMDADDASRAWYVYFNDGDIDYALRSSSYAVRLVRGVQSVDSFTLNFDGTVTQNATGLMWAQCSEGLTGEGCETGSAAHLSWNQALTDAKNSRLGGHSDWRLPNVKELQSLVDYSRYSPSLDSTYFPSTPTVGFWSSSSATAGNSGTSEWFVDFYHGGLRSDVGSDSAAVRLVRGGTNPGIERMLNLAESKFPQLFSPHTSFAAQGYIVRGPYYGDVYLGSKDGRGYSYNWPVGIGPTDQGSVAGITQYLEGLPPSP